MLKITNLISRPVQISNGIVLPVKCSKSFDIEKTDRIKDLAKAKIISVSYVDSPKQITRKIKAQQPAPVLINKNNKNKSQEENKESSIPEENKNKKES